jgi:NTE family protein
VKLYISATNVRTGKPRVFTRTEVDADVLLASACLPNIFRAVEIDGEAVLGRRLPGQPGALAALPRGRRARHPDRADQRHPAAGAADQRLRHHEPLERDQLQRLADERDAGDRLRAAFAGGGAAGAAALPAHLPPLHRRRGPDAEFKLSTKLNGDWEFLQILRRYGHQAADRFLAEHFGSLGRESTLDIKRYL